MRWSPFPVVGGAYSDDAKPWSCQDTLNWIPVTAERPGGRSDAMLRSAPGLVLYSVAGTGVVWGLHDAEGQLFAVIGKTLYQVANDGAAESLGTIPGVGPVSMTHNQITGGNQLVVGTGSTGYVYDTTTETLAQITDEGFPGAKVVDFVDQYIVGVEPMGRFWFHSDLADATSYNTLDRYEAESAPDRIVTLIVTHGDVLVFGERTGEFFYNTGATTGTFQRREGTEMEVGCAAARSVARIDNSVCWLGHDGMVYRLDGYNPRRISTHAIEQAISRCTKSAAFATVFDDRGHKIYYLTFPDGHTWGYDMATGEWHRRASHGMDRWRLNALVRSNGRYIGGDRDRLYILDWDVQNEAGDPLEKRRTTGVLHDAQNRLQVHAMELVFDTGQPSLSGDFSPGLRLEGDVPNGFLGQSVDYQYQVLDALNDHGDVLLINGSLPTGLSMDTLGHVTGTRSAIGTFTWTSEVTGSLNRSDTLEDTSQTINPATWLLSDTGYTRTGTFAANSWTDVTYPTATGYCYYIGGVFHIASQSNTYYTSSDRGSTWTALTPNVSAGGGRICTLGTYQFLCAGVNPVMRRTAATDWVVMAAGARANTIVAHDDMLVVASTYNTKVSRSTDYGVTWAESGEFGNPTGGGSPLLATNGTDMVVAYCETDSVTYTTTVKRSTDGGATWTNAYVIDALTNASNVIAEAIWDGTRFIVATRLGKVVSSADGITWTVSADTIGATFQMAVGEGLVLAVCAGGTVWSSADHGVTWSQRTYPSAGSDILGIAWIYP